MGSRSTRRTSRTASYSCRCTTTCMVWTAKNNAIMCDENASRVSDNAKKFPRGYWTFLGPEDENRWYGTLTYELNGDWDRTAEIMMLIFAESGHTVFRGTSPLYRRSLKSGGGEKSVNTLRRTAELLFRTIIAVTQLSIYGWPIGATTKFFQQRNPTLNTKLQQELIHNSYHASPNTKLWTLEPRKTWRRNVMKNSRILWKEQTWQKMCEDAGFARTGSAKQFSMTRSTVKLRMFGDTSSCRECTRPREDADSYPKGAIGNDNFAQSEHPVFRGTSPLARESLKKGEGAVKVSIHFNAEPQTARIVIPHSAWRQSAQDPRSSGIWV